MLSCEHGMTTALMNAQELWLPAQNQTSQHSSTDWGGAHEASCQLRSYLQLMAVGEVKSFFFRGLVDVKL